MKIEGVTTVVTAINKLQKEAKAADETSVEVGFTMSYAVWVHENMDAAHKAGTQAKFLEDPARRLAKVLGQLVTASYKKSGNFEKSLLIAGYRLLREAQQLCPVLTGALRASGYAALSKDADAVATDAWISGNRMRNNRGRERAARKNKR